MTHFGIISPPVSGHIHPFAALGRELIARGHRVTYLQMIDLEEKIRSEDLDFEAIGSTIIRAARCRNRWPSSDD